MNSVKKTVIAVVLFTIVLTISLVIYSVTKAGSGDDKIKIKKAVLTNVATGSDVFDESDSTSGNIVADNSIGAYIYGNYTNKALNDKEITGNIYYGVRTSENVLYVNRDKVVENLPTNIAKLNIEYSRGKIYRITWSYDVE